MRCRDSRIAERKDKGEGCYITVQYTTLYISGVGKYFWIGGLETGCEVVSRKMFGDPFFSCEEPALVASHCTYIMYTNTIDLDGHQSWQMLYGFVTLVGVMPAKGRKHFPQTISLLAKERINLSLCHQFLHLPT